MKIAHITVYPPKGELHCKKSGVAPYTKNLITNTPYNKNDEVFVICDKDNGIKENYIENGINIHRVFDRNLFFYQKIIEEIDIINPNIVHIQHELFLYGSVLTAILLNKLIKLLKKRNIKIIITFHGVVNLKEVDKDFLKENLSSVPSFLVKKAFTFIFNPIIKNVDKICVYDNYFKEILLNQYHGNNNKIYVIKHGIDSPILKNKLLARKQVGIDINRKMILFMGYITGYKGIDLLIEGMQEYIKNYDSTAILYILGPYHPKLKEDKKYLKEYNRLLEKAQNLLGENHIWDNKFVDGEKMSIYYGATDLSIFPYTRFLGSSGPMSISISYEIPYIASKIILKNKEDNLFSFESNKLDLSKKINSFFNNKDIYKTLILTTKESRNWKNIGSEVIKLYK